MVEHGIGAADVSERTNHVCWVDGDTLAFQEPSVEFLTDGLAAGDRLEYLGSNLDEVRNRIEATPGLDELTLDRRAREAAARIILRSDSPAVRRLTQLLDLRAVRVEVPC